MIIIGGERFRAYGLIRKMVLYSDGVTVSEVDDKGNIVSIMINNGKYGIGSVIEFQCGQHVAFRRVQSFCRDDKFVTIRFTRLTNAYMMLLPLSDFCDINKAFNAFILDDRLVVQVTRGLVGTLYLNTAQEPFYKDKYNALYYADIKDEFYKDYLLIMQSKYSRISGAAIKAIEDFNDGSHDNAVMAIKKDDRLIHTLMKEYNIPNESFFKKYDVELMGKMDMDNEVMKDSDLISVNEPRPREAVPFYERRQLPPGDEHRRCN